MGRFAGLAALIGVALLAGCGEPQPPIGRWQGLYEGADAMIVARLEIGAKGAVRVSAPNAFMNIAALSEDERSAMRADLLAKLARAWPDVGVMPMSFDGKIFRKPGGVAPQMEWDAEHKQMTLIVYPGIHATIRLPMTPVSAFEQS